MPPSGFNARTAVSHGSRNAASRSDGFAADHPADTAAPFARLLCFLRRQIIKPDAGMGVDHTKGLILALQIGDDLRQHRVLEHIGEIARMVAVTVIHRPD
jgi:hypothetical protein